MLLKERMFKLINLLEEIEDPNIVKHVDEPKEFAFYQDRNSIVPFDDNGVLHVYGEAIPITRKDNSYYSHYTYNYELRNILNSSGTNVFSSACWLEENETIIVFSSWKDSLSKGLELNHTSFIYKKTKQEDGSIKWVCYTKHPDLTKKSIMSGIETLFELAKEI